MFKKPMQGQRGDRVGKSKESDTFDSKQYDAAIEAIAYSAGKVIDEIKEERFK